MGKPKKRRKRKSFGACFCQQQLSHPDCCSESLHCILTTNPTLCLEKQSGDMTEIYIGIFRAWMGMTTDVLFVLMDESTKSQLWLCSFIRAR